MRLIPDIAQSHLYGYCILIINKRLKNLLTPNEYYFAKGDGVYIHSDFKLLEQMQTNL